MQKKLILLPLLLIPLVVTAAFSFPKLSPTSSPASTFYSLDDIYNLVAHNTTKETPNSPISTTTSPTATTSYSISEIYALLANTVKQENIKTGITILGVTGNYGTPDQNYATVTTSVISSMIPTSETVVSTGYSLEDIYNLVKIDNSTTAVSGSHLFPAVSSPSATMHTTSEVYTAITNLISYLDTNKNTFDGTVLGVTGNYPVDELRVGMIGYWPFNETSGVVASDYSGNGNNGILNGGALVNQNGKLGKAAGFNNTIDQYASFGDGTGALDVTGNSLSLSAWVYIDSNLQNGNGQWILGKMGDSMGSFGLWVNPNDGSLSFSSQMDDSGSWSDYPSDLTVYFDSWHFVTATYDGSYVRYYVDGVSGTPVELTGNISSQPDPLTTGRETGWDSQAFGGLIDEATIWNRALSEAEVLMLYNNGSGLSLVTNDGSLGSSCSSDSSCDSNNCYVGVCSTALPPLTSGLVGYWPFDEVTGTTTNDLSSGNHDGVFSTGVSTNQSGKIGTSFEFDGTGIVDINSSLSLGTVMTVSAWAYLPETTNGSIINIGCADTGWGCSSTGIGIGIGDTTFDDPGNNFFIVNNGIAWDSPVTSIGAGWHYITVVMASDTIVGQYIDGVYRKNYDAFGQGAKNLPFVPLVTNDTIKIGGYFSDYNRLFTGKIDEVAIWNRPLSAQEISKLYNNGNGMQVITH